MWFIGTPVSWFEFSPIFVYFTHNYRNDSYSEARLELTILKFSIFKEQEDLCHFPIF